MLPQPQYWVLSNHSIARVVGVTQPGYQWSATTISGANVSGALPSGMPDQEVSISSRFPSLQTLLSGMPNQGDALTADPAELQSGEVVLEHPELVTISLGLILFGMCRSGWCCLCRRR